MRVNDRAHSNTGLDLGEGLKFSGIFILWLVSVWAMAILGGR